MFLYVGDPPRDVSAEVFRCDSSSLALSFEEPEATLIDYSNQGAVALDLRLSVPGY
jgi:hypothetical protein